MYNEGFEPMESTSNRVLHPLQSEQDLTDEFLLRVGYEQCTLCKCIFVNATDLASHKREGECGSKKFYYRV